MRNRWIVLGTGLLTAVLAAVPAIQAQNAPLRQPRGARGQVPGGQRVQGTVTAIAADHLTVKTENGDTFQVAIGDNTRLMKDRQPVKITAVKVGDGIGAMGILDDGTKTLHAMMVMVMDAAEMQKMRENLGKTYIVGKVTAIDVDALKITVLRSDNVSQVIAVDEGTSFRRGGRMMMGGQQGSGPGGADESITLADIKVGDMVMGQGALKNGIFVATRLGVSDPSQQRRRREGNNAPGGTSPQ